MTAAVFLDRDGTLIEERGYLDRLDLLTVFPWTADALRLLKRAGFATVVITNQSAIARGMIDEAFLSEVHRELSARLERGGGTIDAYYFCPHLEDAALERRSEEHTSELQSLAYLVCRLLLEKKKK